MSSASPVPTTAARLQATPADPPANSPRPLAAPWPVSAPAWPGSVPDAETAEEAIAAACAGALAPTAFGAAVLASLSEIERAAFAGVEVVDPATLRAAAGLRWRLGAALATVPAQAPVDDVAAAALLAEVDGVLAGLKAASADVPEQLARALEGIRNDLVGAALDLNAALQRLAPAAAPALPPAVAAAAPRAKVLSVEAGEGAQAAVERRGAALYVVLGLAVAIGAGYHGWNAYERSRPAPPPPSFAGAPAGALGAVDPRSGVRTLVVDPARPPTAAELEQFKTEERVKGRIVRELSPGTFVSVPGPQQGSGGTP